MSYPLYPGGIGDKDIGHPQAEELSRGVKRDLRGEKRANRGYTGGISERVQLVEPTNLLLGSTLNPPTVCG